MKKITYKNASHKLKTFKERDIKAVKKEVERTIFRGRVASTIDTRTLKQMLQQARRPFGDLEHELSKAEREVTKNLDAGFVNGLETCQELLIGMKNDVEKIGNDEVVDYRGLATKLEQLDSERNK